MCADGTNTMLPHVCICHKCHVSPCMHMPWMLCFPMYTYASLMCTHAMDIMLPPCVQIPWILCFPYVYRCHEYHASTMCTHAMDIMFCPCVQMPQISCFIHVYICQEYHASPVYTNLMNSMHFYVPLRRCHTIMESVCLSACSALLSILHLGY